MVDRVEGGNPRAGVGVEERNRLSQVADKVVKILVEALAVVHSGRQCATVGREGERANSCWRGQESSFLASCFPGRHAVSRGSLGPPSGFAYARTPTRTWSGWLRRSTAARRPPSASGRATWSHTSRVA